MSIIQIKSDNKIADINRHFKVTAGPGAGKTYWLINHIKNVLHNSDKLHKTGKIACITYTNIAVETILSRLGESSSNQVEVSTIHSFLYKNIVKPYASFIADEYNLNVAKMDGHDDVILSNYSSLDEWKNKTSQQRIRDNNAIIDAICRIRWKFENNQLIIKPDYPAKIDGYSIKNSSYLEYKKILWGKGLLHHDDVLFFSFQIIQKYPFVAKILASKFPYVFIDEFQDSNPIQVEIVKFLVNSGSFIGVIGDVAQSIYEFQGANIKLFESFSVPKMVNYQLSENRRSANEIIDILNYVRSDISQQKHRLASYNKPTIIVGDKTTAYIKAVERCKSEEVQSLSRQNITSNTMRHDVSGIITDGKLFDKYRAEDSNYERCKFINSFIKAIAYANGTKFSDAIKELDKLFRKENDKLVQKRNSLDILTLLLANYAKYQNNTLLYFINEMCIKIFPNLKIAKLKKGKAQIFCEETTVKQMMLCVSIPDDLSLHKTIHKAKGDEFDNVFLILTEEKHLEFLTNPALLENEEHRINYVAISRARNRLFINVPTLSMDNQAILNDKFDILNV